MGYKLRKGKGIAYEYFTKNYDKLSLFQDR